MPYVETLDLGGNQNCSGVNKLANCWGSLLRYWGATSPLPWFQQSVCLLSSFKLCQINLEGKTFYSKKDKPLCKSHAFAPVWEDRHHLSRGRKDAVSSHFPIPALTTARLRFSSLQILSRPAHAFPPALEGNRTSDSRSPLMQLGSCWLTCTI